MMRRSYIGLLIIALIGWATMQSCKSKKEIVSASTVDAKEAERLFIDILENQFDFNTFSSNINLNLSFGTKSLSSKSSLRIIKNQAIQLSIQPLFGVEMLRLYLDKDTLVILDRMNKRYIRESIEDVKREYPVGFDFVTLQSLLTNRFFVSGDTSVQYSDFSRFVTKKLSDYYYLLESVDWASGIEYRFAINSNDNIATTQLKEPKKKYELIWEYGEFLNDNQKIFPHKMNVDFVASKRKASLGLEFSGIVLDDEFDLSISIPKGYRRAYISDIIKIITAN